MAGANQPDLPGTEHHEKLGWLSAEHIIQTDKPNKKLYSITPAGKAELSTWLKKSSPDDIRSGFLMRLFFAGELSRSEAVTVLAEYKKETEAMLEGMAENGAHQVDVVTIKDSDVGHCLGCYACWTKTPGRCVLNDDMEGLIQKYLKADLVVWSFPLYYFGMPSKVKAFLDRLLPTNLPFMQANAADTSGHPPRFDLSHQRVVLVSTCGFFSTKGNYDALFQQFEILYGGKLTKIICPEGELFRVPQLNGRTGEYLAHVKTAGAEFAANGVFSAQTQAKLDELLFPPEAFVEMADASWDIAPESGAAAGDEPAKDGKAARFLRQMAAIYQKDAYAKAVPTVLEFYFSDLDETLQLKFDRQGCRLLEAKEPFTTRIETGFSLWQDISAGKLSGPKAMFEKKYRVQGEFDTMLKMGDYFGLAEAPKEEKAAEKRDPNMLFLLLPWLALWVGLPISGQYGGMAGILVAAAVPLLARRAKLTVYDKTGGLLVAGIGVAALMGLHSGVLVPASYLAFALLWLASLFFSVPLTAHYSAKGFGGGAAFENPLFIKTNRILTAAWGLLYIAMAVLGYALLQTPVGPYLGLVGSVPPALMGLFTAWFVKWYPAHYAGLPGRAGRAG